MIHEIEPALANGSADAIMLAEYEAALAASFARADVSASCTQAQINGTTGQVQIPRACNRTESTTQLNCCTLNELARLCAQPLGSADHIDMFHQGPYLRRCSSVFSPAESIQRAGTFFGCDVCDRLPASVSGRDVCYLKCHDDDGRNLTSRFDGGDGGGGGRRRSVPIGGTPPTCQCIP